MRTPLLRRHERTRAEAQLSLAAHLSESDRALVSRAMALLADTRWVLPEPRRTEEHHVVLVRVEVQRPRRAMSPRAGATP